MEQTQNKPTQATPDGESELYLPDKAVEKINLHCYVMEKCLTGACTIIEQILSGEKLEAVASATDFNQFGGESSDIPKPIILANAIIIGSKIYEQIVDDIEKEITKE